MIKKKRSQTWSVDFMLGLTFFAAGVIIFFTYNNLSGSSDYETVDMYTEVKALTDYLITDGYPDNWNQSNVLRVGLTSGDHILNTTKLSEFANMTKVDYLKSKTLLNAKSDFVIYFMDKDDNILNLSETFIGKQNYNSTNIDVPNTRNIVKIFRYLVYKHGDPVSAEIIKMEVLYWN